MTSHISRETRPSSDREPSLPSSPSWPMDLLIVSECDAIVLVKMLTCASNIIVRLHIKASKPKVRGEIRGQGVIIGVSHVSVPSPLVHPAFARARK